MEAWLQAALEHPALQLLAENAWKVIRYPIRSSQRIYWLYVLTAAAFAFFVYWRAQARAGERRSGRGFWRFCFPKSIWSTKSAWLDMRYFFVHQLVRVWIYGGFSIWLKMGTFALLLPVATWAFGPAATRQPISGTDIFVVTALVIVVGDAVAYYMHLAQHRFPLLWEFHKVHHSPKVLHPLSNYREHWVDNFGYALVQSVAMGIIVTGLFYLRGQTRLPIWTVLKIDIFTLAYNLAAYNLRHSHIWIAWPAWLGRLFGSPAYHQIHHSALPEHIDKNMAFKFPVWDWLHDTQVLPTREPVELRFGLGDGSEPEYSSIARLYALPFVKLWRRYTGSPGVA